MGAGAGNHIENLCRVVSFVKLPQARNPVQGIVAEESAKICRDPKQKGKCQINAQAAFYAFGGKILFENLNGPSFGDCDRKKQVDQKNVVSGSRVK